MNIDYYEIRVLDRSDVQQTLISSTAHSGVVACKFSLSRNGGCGEFSLTVKKGSYQGTISFGDLIEFWAKTKTGSLTQYYRGVVITVPVTTTRQTETFEAEGLWFQLSKQIITKYYEGDDIDVIVEDILGDVDTTDSDVETSTSEIDISAPYAAGDVEMELVSATELITRMAELQGDVQYGVDQTGKLYFKDLSTTDMAHFFVGHGLDDFDVRQTTDNVINRAILRAKAMVGADWLTLTRDDTTSSTKIATLGIRSKVIKAPVFRQIADIWRYGNNILDSNGVKNICDANPTGFSDFIFPRGNVRITDTDGTEYSLPILNVTYALDPVAGLVGEMSLGDEEISAEEEIRNMLREATILGSDSIALTKIAHTRGEEFMQNAYTQAQRVGLLNHYLDLFTDIKGLDLDTSVHIWHDEVRHCVTGEPIPSLPTAYYYTKVLDTDQVPTVAQVHVLYDCCGRLDFTRDADFTEFWEEENPDTWALEETESKVYQSSAGTGDRLWYVPPENYTWPARFRVRFYLTDFENYGTGAYTAFIWDHLNDVVQFNYIRIWNISAGINQGLYAELWKNSGGVHTQYGTGQIKVNADENAVFDLEVRHTGDVDDTTTLIVTDDQGFSDTISTDQANSTSDRKIGIAAFDWGITSGGCKLGWIEFPELAISGGAVVDHSIQISFSRDGGSNWHDYEIDPDETELHYGLVLPASGHEILLKGEVTWPGRIYGWGYSFKN